MSVRSDIPGRGPDPVRTVTGSRCSDAAHRRPRRPRPRQNASPRPSGEGAVIIPFPVRRPGPPAGAAVRPLRLTRRGHAVVTAALLLAVGAVLALGAVVSGHLV